MSDIAASEQRLIAALDRIDRSMDAAAARRAPAAERMPAPADDDALATAGAEIARLTAEMAALREVRAAEIAQMEAMLATVENLLIAEAPAEDAPAHSPTFSPAEGR